MDDKHHGASQEDTEGATPEGKSVAPALDVTLLLLY